MIILINMQRLVKLYEATYREIDDFNEEFLDKGWSVKSITTVEKVLIIKEVMLRSSPKVVF